MSDLIRYEDFMEREVDRQDRVIQELRDENDRLRKQVKDAFHAGWVYACADVKRGHRNSMYVDGRFHKWEGSSA